MRPQQPILAKPSKVISVQLRKVATCCRKQPTREGERDGKSVGAGGDAASTRVGVALSPPACGLGGAVSHSR